MTFRRTRCPHCKGKLEPGQRIHPDCIDGYAEAQAAKAERKKAKELRAKQRVERAQDKKRRQEQKRTSQWEAECRAIVQVIARLRDKDDGCISCHMPANYGGVWHGSHFRSVAAASAVQFNLWNIHKACAQCNLFKSGNIAAYTPRLIEKIGQEKVDWLLAQNQVVRHPVEYYIKFKHIMGKKLRRMKARME